MRLSSGATKKGLIFLALGITVFVGGWALGLRTQSKHAVFHNNFLHPFLTKEELQTKITKLNDQNIYNFTQTEANLEGFDEPVIFDYAFDPSIQSVAETLMARYKPDLGAIVAMDASTGRVLAMVGQNRAFEMQGNPAIAMSYPAASVFKVITATATLEKSKMSPASMMAYAGRNHTLYKSQLKEKVSGWKRTCTLKEAFARSLNPVFGRLGVFLLGKENIQNCSNRFVFNENIPSEFPIASSKSANPTDDYELAEMASGYTQNNTMTPLHGAMIAAAVANDGVMMEPYFLNAAYLKTGKPIYRAEPSVMSQVMSPDTAAELRTLMRETVIRGTSRTAFRGFFKGKFSQVDVGGKTGHLTDHTLKGNIDWFVGFGQLHGRKIAISVLTMHKKYWTVKSSYLARRAIETAFTPPKAVAQK
jgi:peptidoglycan glycosyltransferase